MNKQEKYDKLYLDIATRVSKMSHATRKKVGAVIVKDGNTISFGWNGRVAGADNCCEDENGVTLPDVIHAEQNALYKLARSSESAVGSVLYCTLSPCVTCALGIIQAGVSRVVYLEEYSNLEGVDLLRNSGVKADMVRENELTVDEKEFNLYLNDLRECIRGGLYEYSYATWVFDRIGRRGHEEDLENYSYGEVKEMLHKREIIKKVLISQFGEDAGKDIYNDWYNGLHDT